jgi:hypothetical protein
MPVEIAAGLTVADVAKRYRLSPDRFRGWIRRGELRAVNSRDCRAAGPSWVVPPDALAEFELGRAAATVPPKPPPDAKEDFASGLLPGLDRVIVGYYPEAKEDGLSSFARS